MIWQSVICCIAIFNLALIHKRNIKNYTISLSQAGLEGSYWGWFLLLQWLISFQESMTELNAAHHLSMGSNFENKQHIRWKAYLKNSTALKMRIALWEGCFMICYCIYWTFSVVCTVHVLSKLFKHSFFCFFFFFFIFHTLCSCKHFLVLMTFLVWSYSSPPPPQLCYPIVILQQPWGH